MLCCVKPKASPPDKENEKVPKDGKRSPSKENLVQEDLKKESVPVEHTNKAFEEVNENGKASKSPDRKKSKSRSPSKEPEKKKEKESSKSKKEKSKSKSPSPVKESKKHKSQSPQKEAKNKSVSPEQVILTTKNSTNLLNSQQQQNIADEEEIDEAMAAELSSLISRLETVTTRLEAVGAGGGGGGEGDGPDAAFVQEFDATIKAPFSNFMQLSSKIGDDVKTQAGLVEAAFNAQRDVVALASKAKKPSDADLPKVMGPLFTKLTAIQDFRKKKKVPTATLR